MMKKTIKCACAAAMTVMLMQNAVFAHNLVKDSGFEIQTYADGVTVSKPVYTVDGTQISTLAGQAGKTVTVTVPAVRNTKTSKSLNMITGLFDANDTYVTGNIIEKTVTALDGSDNLVSTITLGNDVTAEYKLKTFIWSDISDLKPYTEMFELASSAVNTAWTLGEDWSIDIRDTIGNDASKYGFGSLKSRGNVTDKGNASQTVSVKSGHAYLLSFYVNGQTDSSMQVELISNGTTLKKETLTLTYGYSRKLVPFVADSDSVELKFTNLSSSNLSIDCVSLDENLIVNSDFENGNTEGWPTNAAGGDTLTRVLDTETVHSGTASMRIDGRRDLNSGVMQWVQDVIKVTGPGTYELGGWIKTGNGGAPRFEISKSVSGQSTETSTKIADNASDWVYDIATMTFTQNDIYNLNNVKINFWAGGDSLADGTKGSMWLDDMYLVNRGNNLYMNGDFEYGETLGYGGKKWSCSNGGNSAFKVYADTSEKHSGTASACVYGRNGATDHARMPIPDIIKENGTGTYRLSAWVKGNGGWTFMDCNILNGVVNKSESGSNDTNWHEITYDITIPDGTDISGLNSSNAYIDIWCGTPAGGFLSGNAGKIWFDDISIVKVDSTSVSE